ncbi:hypothetical protein CRG98_010638 [Punica granatum]|uniref:Uncharacterized protein n=1 Tax=Punica granatum TaxID=22663 RepID=A0A2I0KKD0_PUNGR|nr:hypothetical protein CRG98_010638 [Punica granatum]
MEQVPDRLSRLLLASQVSPNLEKGPCQTESNAGSAFDGKLTSELHATRSLPLLGSKKSFRLGPSLGTFGTFHERLDLSLRSPRKPILHRAVVEASVPTPFSPGCRCCCLTGAHCPSRLAESCDSQGQFPDSFPCASRLGNISLRLREAGILDWETTYFEVGEALVVRRGHGNSRPRLPKGWPRVPLSLTDARGALSPQSSLLPTPYCL